MIKGTDGQAAFRARWTLRIVAVLMTIPGLLLLRVTPALAFVGEGDIAGSNPTSEFLGGNTENDFVDTCTYPPESQGADGLVFDIGSETGDATAIGSSEDLYDLDLAFYSADCSFISQSADHLAPDETAPVPQGTRYVVVNASVGANIHVCLVVGSGMCPGPSSPPASTPPSTPPPSTTTPPTTPTPTPTPTDSSTPTPTPTPSTTDTPSPTPSPTSTFTPASEGNISATIVVSQTKVGYRRPFVISGQVTADDFCKRPYLLTMTRAVNGRAHVVNDTIPVSKTDGWQITANARFSASYAVTPRDAGSCTAHATTPKRVAVGVRISVEPPIACEDDATGKVRPNHKGQTVKLQRRVDGKWLKISRTTLTKRSRFRLPLAECHGRFRVVYRAQDERNGGGFRGFRL